MKKSFCFLWVLVAMFSACEKEVVFKQQAIEPMVVMECLASMNDTMQVQLSQSRFFLDNTDTFPLINDATLSLYVNDDFVETLSSISDGKYQSNYLPQVGDKMRLEAEVSGYPTVFAENTMTKPIDAFSIDTTTTFVGSDSVYIPGYYTGYFDDPDSVLEIGWFVTKELAYTVTLEFKDDATTDDYYYLSLDRKLFNYDDGMYIDGIDVYSGNVNDYTQSSYDTRFFSDEYANGKTIRIRINLTMRNASGHPGILHISLSTISKAYYEYMKTSDLYSEMDGLGFLFVEPVQVYSNVQNGIGLFGSYSEIKDSLLLLP